MVDTYLDVAQKVLGFVREPMSPKEILKVARERDLLPRELYGKTQHKTLQARLSEDIICYREDSQFYRTSPGRFFLRAMLNDETIPSQYRRVFRAPRRQKSLYDENVLVVPRVEFEKLNIMGFQRQAEKLIELFASNVALYVDRRIAENDHSLKQIVTYIVVRHGTDVLSYRRGNFSRAADALRGALSIGFGGHVCESDLDLLNHDPIGIHKNACRELSEELALIDAANASPESPSQLTIFGVINDETTEEGRKHAAVVMQYACRSKRQPLKGELSINNLRWLSLIDRPNKIDDFEAWSRILFEVLFKELAASRRRAY